ncbi:hypothetical protein CEXT_35121 [Caerostris extrusa]|uniref:Uncharacterized protein n=1 Tax=Caerostris extrusa TaxID=172846 RepID=A0AAV4VQF6_CAEEX|nr:hypothetical protein CEXT_35121 [Caerostris extrusa]
MCIDNQFKVATTDFQDPYLTTIAGRNIQLTISNDNITKASKTIKQNEISSLYEQHWLKKRRTNQKSRAEAHQPIDRALLEGARGLLTARTLIGKK